MKIYLIRHGESESDVKERYDGDYDDHLTEKGLKEAEIVANKLVDSGIRVIYSSDKIRAVETSDVLKDVLKCEVVISSDLGEQDIYGAFPELSKDQSEEEYRRLGEVIANRDIDFEGSETYLHFKKRVTEYFSTIVNSGSDIVAIVTHGGPIRCIFRDVLALGEFEKISNGAIIELQKSGSDFNVIKMDGAIMKK